jgi:hypothetical protein
VTMPASFFSTDDLPRDAWPLALSLAFSFIPVGVGDSGVRSCLLAYSDDGSRRTGIACFVRAMARRVLAGSPRTLITLSLFNTKAIAIQAWPVVNSKSIYFQARARTRKTGKRMQVKTKDCGVGN